MHELWPRDETSGKLKCSESLLDICLAHCPTNQCTIMWLLEEIVYYYSCQLQTAGPKGGLAKIGPDRMAMRKLSKP